MSLISGAGYGSADNKDGDLFCQETTDLDDCCESSFFDLDFGLRRDEFDGTGHLDDDYCLTKPGFSGKNTTTVANIFSSSSPSLKSSLDDNVNLIEQAGRSLHSCLPQRPLLQQSQHRRDQMQHLGHLCCDTLPQHNAHRSIPKSQKLVHRLRPDGISISHQDLLSLEGRGPASSGPRGIPSLPLPQTPPSTPSRLRSEQAKKPQSPRTPKERGARVVKTNKSTNINTKTIGNSSNNDVHGKEMQPSNYYIDQGETPLQQGWKRTNSNSNSSSGTRQHAYTAESSPLFVPLSPPPSAKATRLARGDSQQLAVSTAMTDASMYASIMPPSNIPASAHALRHVIDAAHTAHGYEHECEHEYEHQPLVSPLSPWMENYHDGITAAAGAGGTAAYSPVSPLLEELPQQPHVCLVQPAPTSSQMLVQPPSYSFSSSGFDDGRGGHDERGQEAFPEGGPVSASYGCQYQAPDHGGLMIDFDGASPPNSFDATQYFGHVPGGLHPWGHYVKDGVSEDEYYGYYYCNNYDGYGGYDARVPATGQSATEVLSYPIHTLDKDKTARNRSSTASKGRGGTGRRRAAGHVRSKSSGSGELLTAKQKQQSQKRQQKSSPARSLKSSISSPSISSAGAGKSLQSSLSSSSRALSSSATSTSSASQTRGKSAVNAAKAALSRALTSSTNTTTPTSPQIFARPPLPLSDSGDGSDMFVNYTPSDSRRILTGVAPSGSSKTKARREREALERRRRLSEAAARAVREAGGDWERVAGELVEV